MLPSLKDYTIEDTQDAVEVIRETTDELDAQEDILPILKTCHNIEDIREYLKELAQSRTEQANLTTMPSRNPTPLDYDRRPPASATRVS